MLAGLKHMYPNLPVHFYPYAFIVCPDKYVAGFYSFFNTWWHLHEAHYLWDYEGISLYKVIEAKCNDYLKSMDSEELEYIEKQIINGYSDEEINKVVRQFLMNKQRG